jgi:hypothetical protein
MTRQAMRMRYLTRDPSGPKMRRLDLLLSSETFGKLEEIMDNTNMRRREALVAMIDAYHVHVTADLKRPA